MLRPRSQARNYCTSLLQGWIRFQNERFSHLAQVAFLTTFRGTALVSQWYVPLKATQSGLPIHTFTLLMIKQS